MFERERTVFFFILALRVCHQSPSCLQSLDATQEAKMQCSRVVDRVDRG